MTDSIDYPEDFLWGATLSAHQVEGDNYANDWWRWEQRPGRILDGANSQVASGHFEQYASDIDLARKLGLQSLFLPIEWSRVQPAAGVFDENAIMHYHEVLSCLVDCGIEPICVLCHAALPQWMANRRGWTHPRSALWFEGYVARMAAEFAPTCRYWIPLYEPMHAIRLGLGEGIWPPGKHNAGLTMLWSLQHLTQAHDAAYHAIHAQRPDAQVGVALRGRQCAPLDPDQAWDVRHAHGHEVWPHHFLNPPGASRVTLALDPFWFQSGTPSVSSCARALDFLGVSYYGTEIIRFNPLKIRRCFVDYMDKAGNAIHVEKTEAAPAGLYPVVQSMARYGLPLWIAGNGVATSDDATRCSFLLDHLAVMRECIREGVDIRGYFHRSFLDGFEWTRGYQARYGLVHVARESLDRTPNPSAYLYKDICETNTIRKGTCARFCPGWTAAKEQSIS